jgi:hypothetical protein
MSRTSSSRTKTRSTSATAASEPCPWPRPEPSSDQAARPSPPAAATAAMVPMATTARATAPARAHGYGNYGAYQRGGAGAGNPLHNGLPAHAAGALLVGHPARGPRLPDARPAQHVQHRCRNTAPPAGSASSASPRTSTAVLRRPTTTSRSSPTTTSSPRSRRCAAPTSSKASPSASPRPSVSIVLEPYQAGNIFSGPLTEQEVFAKQRGITPQRQTLVINVDFTHPNRDLARQVAQPLLRVHPEVQRR